MRIISKFLAGIVKAIFLGASTVITILVTIAVCLVCMIVGGVFLVFFIWMLLWFAMWLASGDASMLANMGQAALIAILAASAMLLVVQAMGRFLKNFRRRPVAAKINHSPPMLAASFSRRPLRHIGR